MRYFFHVHNGVDCPDNEGVELPDDEAARVEAFRAAAEAIGEMGDRFWQHGKWQMQVVCDGRLVRTLNFAGSVTDF